MIDIVLPNGNEEEFIAIAEQLGMTGLCFLYDKPKDITSLQKTSRIPLYAAITQLSKRADLRMMQGRENLRDVLEKTNVDLAFEIEEAKEKDFMHQRNAGMNHILANIAHEKQRMIGFSIHLLLTTSGRIRAQTIGRMMQNVAVCRKYKVQMVLASFARTPWQMRNKEEVKAIGMMISMQPGEAKAAIEALKQHIDRNRRQRDPDYLGEGIERL